MVGVSAISSQVLLVGDTGNRLEGELAVHGLAFAKAPTANDAVARMKTTRFPFVVVSPILADMGGVDFIHGVLRHFDASVVLYGNGIESSEINALLRTGRVAHFPGTVEGGTVADFLARRAGSATPTPMPRPPSAVTTGAPAFNLTPGPAPSTGFSGASAPLASSGMFGSSPPQVSSAATTFPPFAAASFAAGASGAMPPSPSGQRELQARFEAMADELARSNAELVSMRGRVAVLDQEKAELLVEVEAARRSAMQDIAQVMALSDEGAAIDSELEDAKAMLAAAAAAAERTNSELASVRAERERLASEMAEASGRLAEATMGRAAAEAELAGLAELNNAAARAETEQLRLDLEGARAELEIVRDNARSDVERIEAMVVMERNGRAEAEGNLTRFRLESDEKWTAALADESERAAAAEERALQLEKQRNELAQALADGAEVEAAQRTELDRLRGDVAAARTDATTVRLDLQEALLRLEELNGALQSLTLERDTLRDEAGPLREWGNALVAAHAQQQGELERLRPLLAAAAAHEATIAALKSQLASRGSSGSSSSSGSSGGPGPDVEVWLARSRQLADLVRALEPFMWGLTQATGFYKEQPVPGGEAHLRSLQQLQGVLLRLRDEIAMLDLG